MTFIERTDKLLLLEGLLDEAVDGTGQVVSITGPVGSGKTELAQQLASRATDQGVRVVQTHAAPADVSAGLSTFGQLLEACTSAVELRHRLTTAASDDALSPLLILAICHDLLRSAAQTPLLLIADDVHLADAESLRGLLYLVRCSRTAPVMLVLVTSEYSQQTIPLFHAELFRERHHRQVQLPLLTVDGVAGILAERLDAATAHRLAPDAHAASGGNPLVVRALLEEHLANCSATGKEALNPGDASATAVLACLHRSGPGGLDVARAIALLLERATPELISRLIARPRRLVEQYLAELSEAGLTGPDGLLRHPAARSTVLNDPAFGNSDELRYRAAELLHDEGETPLRIAEHLIAADRTGNHCHISLLREAAEEALDHRQAELAVQCLDLALRNCPDGEEQALITAAKVRVEWRMNPARAMSHFNGLLDAFERGHLPDLEAIMLARALMWHGREEEVARILDTIRQRAHVPEVGKAMLSTDQSLRITHPGSVVVLRERPAAGPMADAAMWDHLQAGDYEATAQLAEDALRNDHSPDYWRGPHCNALYALVYVNELKRAEYWTTRIYQNTEPDGFRTWQAVQSTILAEVARRGGDLPTASRLARDALLSMGPRAWGPQIELPLATLISAATAMGHHRTAAEWLAHPLPEGEPKTRYRLHYLEARGQHHVAMGRYLPALRDFASCGRLMDSWDMDIPGIVPWRLGLAEALIGLGRTERAARTLDEQAARPGTRHPRIQGSLLRLRAATVKPRQSVALLRESVDLLESSQLPMELLATLIDLNRVYVELGDPHRARFTARWIWRIAAKCGAEAHVRRMLLPEFAAIRTDVGSAPAAGDDMYTVLSDAELRVAELAACGHTNRDIAGLLYVTVSTVEQHLTRVYRKLRVGGRAELQARLNPKLRSTA